VGRLSGADTWRAVDAGGRDPATGRAPSYPGAPSAPAALAAVPIASWPLVAVSSGGHTLGLAEALGPGGERVTELIDRLARRAAPPAELPVCDLARRTPAGTVDLPAAMVGLDDAVRLADEVDRAWMAAVEERRSAPRARPAAGGRGVELEAALNLAMLIGTDAVGGDGDGMDLEARVASGARLWLLGGAVAWALAGGDDPFTPWAELVSFGLWPVGPVRGQLVLHSPPASLRHDAA
jgi:hypothetical protein